MHLGLEERAQSIRVLGVKSRGPEFKSQATHVKPCMATRSCNLMSLGGDRLHHTICTPCQLLQNVIENTRRKVCKFEIEFVIIS